MIICKYDLCQNQFNTREEYLKPIFAPFSYTLKITKLKIINKQIYVTHKKVINLLIQNAKNKKNIYKQNFKNNKSFDIS